MIIVYTGNGKGKTSACVGQAVRAAGRGLRVAFGQFMKRDGQAGEQKILSELLAPSRFFAGGEGFFRREEDRPIHRAAARIVLEWAAEQIGVCDMVVLDESLYALDAGLVSHAEIEGLIAEARHAGRHLVLSGRNMPAWLAEQADLITCMEEVKHPLRNGVKAAPGIEF